MVAEAKETNPGKYFVMCNFANDLHGATPNQNVASAFRRSCADTFKESKVAKLISDEYGFDEEAVEQES